MTKPRRNRTTRRSVVLGERLARTAITLGGLGTILAVTLIFVFLAWIVLPLFSSPSSSEATERPAARPRTTAPLRLAVDGERLMAWSLDPDGVLTPMSLVGGEDPAPSRPFAGSAPTAASFPIVGEQVVFGYEDGSISLTESKDEMEFLAVEEVPEELRDLAPGSAQVFDSGVLERTPQDQFRVTRHELEEGEHLSTGEESAVVAVDHSSTPQGIYLISLHASGALRVARVRERENLMTGKVTRSLSKVELPRSEESLARGLPMSVLVEGIGQHAYVIWSDGTCVHWDLSSFHAPRALEEIDLTPQGAEVTCAAFVAGKKTLLIGDDQGRVRTWFTARLGADDAPPLLVQSGTWPGPEARVTALTPSPRARIVVAAYATGELRAFQSTLGEELLRLKADTSPLAVAVAPKQDAVFALTRDGLLSWEVDLAYPEASPTALFRPIWYENYPEPQHVWQSSSASDDFEPKLGMMPLVFGTVKATLYSMLFGAPLAILAAIFTSEFLSQRMRAPIKSLVELMASLPSVVLGFIGGLIIAPFVQGTLATVLLSFVTIPLTALAGAYLWQLMPTHRAISLAGFPRFLMIGLTLPTGALVAMGLAPLVESLFFAGDLSTWLTGSDTNTFGGWLFFLLPLAGVLVSMGYGWILAPRLTKRTADWKRPQVARFALLKYGLGIAATLAVAGLLAAGIEATGLDPRGGVVGTYVQQNALVVGFAMGFAIIPIIYTLAEDSLSEVPSQLREGSLGAGATQWQTAVRIVLPFAMSGIFSALMIGLGRAVGETMIVLMAAGNTPIMEWNAFNGFRTLSANIAVELPEAVIGSAHYRSLFLAGLVLFGMTFALNTVAELVRRHFRKRMQSL